MPTILIVDDEQDMQQLIEMILHKHGYTVEKASNGEEAYTIIAHKKIDLVLLDVMMPGEDGFQVCSSILQIDSVPIIFLTAVDSTEDKVHGLKLGADDYIVKPFTASELMARIEAVLRRVKLAETIAPQPAVHEYGPIKLREDSRTIYVNDTPLNLTFKEYELLALFLRHPNIVYTREKLLQIVWHGEYEGGTRTVDTHIKTLRIKLGQQCKQAAQLIETVWGVGYRFGAWK